MKRNVSYILFLLLSLSFSHLLFAESSLTLSSNAREKMDTALFSEPVEVISGIWVAVGATAPPSYENGGHNNNLSFILTKEGVVVVNAGNSYLLSAALHDRIKKITQQPVKYVVLENGQGHAMMGMNYWQELGVKIIAHEDTFTEIEEHGHDIEDRSKTFLRDKFHKTKLSKPDISFEDKYVIDLGDERIELLNLGPAHSPGDTMVWLPKRSLIITGDMAFHERLLPIFEHTDTAGWLDTWEKFADLKAQHVIPGHGSPTNMAEVTKYTKNYLEYLRDKIGVLIEDGGDLTDAYEIDQSPYKHLDTFKELAKRNAGRVFQEMEFE